MDTQLLALLAKYDATLVKLGAVLGNVSPYGKSQKQRTKENRTRAKQRKQFKLDIRSTERLIVIRCIELRDQHE